MPFQFQRYEKAKQRVAKYFLSERRSMMRLRMCTIYFRFLIGIIVNEESKIVAYFEIRLCRGQLNITEIVTHFGIRCFAYS